MKPEEAVARRLTLARSVAVLTGAGVSAESGISTFRSGPDALWRNRRPEDLATPDAFARDPRLVWDWYGGRLRALQMARPNAGHAALARIGSLLPRFTIITQNVDGLHAAAGSSEVIELHGNIRRARCVRCATIRTDHVETACSGSIPYCPCGSMLRPDVVWFGEALDRSVLDAALIAARSADVFVIAGTSAVVYPAAALADVAQDAGAFLVEVNPESTDASASCDVTVRERAGVFFPALERAFSDLRRSPTAR